MKKKYIFILAAIVIIIAVLIISSVVSKNMNSPKTSVSSNQNANGNNAIPPLSGNGLNNASQPAVTSEEIGQQIKNNAEAAKNQETKISEFTVKDSNGKIVPFRNFLQSSGAKIDEPVLKLSDELEYTLFNCSAASSASPTGLIFEVNKDQDLKSYVSSGDPLKNNVKKWENKMFQDLSPIFFPGESFFQTPIFNETRFDTSNGINSIVIRYANLKSNSGKTFSIDWSMFYDQIFISSNKDCLRQLLNKHQDQLEP